MFGINKISSIRIEYLDLLYLLKQGTGNPIAEEQIPQLLREVLRGANLFMSHKGIWLRN